MAVKKKATPKKTVRKRPASNLVETVQRRVILVLAILITILFLAMIRSFIMPLLLGAILTGLLYPVYEYFKGKLNEKEILASLSTLVAFGLIIILPLSLLLGVVVTQAARVSESVTPWIQTQLKETTDWEDRLIETVPFMERLVPFREQLISRAGEAAGKTGTMILNGLSSAAKGTALFLLDFFIMLYSMFFFFIYGRHLITKLTENLPMTEANKERLIHRFISVAHATLKGVIVIGVLQGTLAGVAFAVAGIQGAVFWGAVMAVLSVLPAIGSALVWVPAVVFLLIKGSWVAAILLAIWCAGVVGSVDNVLRPRLVGRDTQMPDLLVLLGTLGGISLLGAAGMIIGPVIAALFITIWEMYARAFRPWLGQPEKLPNNPA